MLDRPIAFLATARPEASREFYESTLGLTFVEDAGPALVFDVGGVPLRIQKVDAEPAVERTVFGWAVADIQATVAELAERGVRCEMYDFLEQTPEGVWTSPGGARVAWFRDPDGNVLSLTEG